MSLQEDMEQVRIETVSDEQIQAAAILTHRIIAHANALAEVIVAEAVKLAKARLQETDS